MSEELENVEPVDEFSSEVSENSYSAENIQKLEGLEAVRMRPAMYIGDTGSRGLHHLFTEVVDNSIDEHLAGYCSEIKVILGNDNTVTVIDNGRGIPTGWKPEYGMSAMELVLTNLHAGGKFDGGGYKVSGGLHGVGVSCVNALSEWMEVWVKREGKEVYQRFERGVAILDENNSHELQVLRDDLDESDTGTTVKYYADKEIFGEIVYDPAIFKTRLRELAFLNKGLKIIFVNELPYDNLSELRKKQEVKKVMVDTSDEEADIDLSEDFANDQGKEEAIPEPEVPTARTSVFLYERGINEYIEYLNKNKTVLHSPVYFEAFKEKVEVEIAFQYNDTFREDILSYVNNIHTQEGGTHLTGFRTALTRVINNYGRANNLIKEKEKNLSGDDVKEGLCAIISCKIENPQFEGQTKTKLGNSEVAGIVTNIVSEQLANYMDEHPQASKRIIDKCLTAQRAREAARKAADLVKRSGAMDSFSLPGKLADCNEKDPSKCELFIVEGQSAGGSAKSGRNRATQAILPLRGKILNVEKSRPERSLENEEIKSLVSAIGTGISIFDTGDTGEEDALPIEMPVANEKTSNKQKAASFDISKLRYDKIIIMTDADVDGAHIRTLLLTFFFRYMTPLIEQGHIYAAQPPLFKVKKGADYVEYAKSDEQLDEMVKRLKDKKGGELIVSRFKGLGEMNASDLAETTMDPATRSLARVTMDDAREADQLFSVLLGDVVDPRKKYIVDHAAEIMEDIDWQA